MPVTDRWPEVMEKVDIATDAALGNMAMDIERLAKQRVPIRKGVLMSKIKHERKGMMHFIVKADTEYALYQEMGARMDGSHVVKNYTKPGTGKFYLSESGAIIARVAPEYFKATRTAMGVF